MTRTIRPVPGTAPDRDQSSSRMKQPTPHLQAQIRDLIHQHFDLEEFRDLCFRLGVGYDDLRGENLPGRIRDLVLRLNRERRLDDLLTFCAHLRPAVDWPDLSLEVALDPAPAAFVVPTRNPRQIFFSHARQDADFAHRLAADLGRFGWQVWIAPDSIRPGEKWVNAINRGLAESGVFLLALTPDAVNSKWVHSETNVAIGLEHDDLVRFIPLDVRPAAVPPLWRSYQWIPFRDGYEAGLQQLLEELQPEEMAQVAVLYRQLEQAMQQRDRATAQTLAAQINDLYPDYRKTNDLLTQARREEAHEQASQAEVDQLYSRLQAAIAAADWSTTLKLAQQIEATIPDYRDVAKLAQRARRVQRQSQRDALNEWMNRIPVWGWGGGVLLGLVVIFFFFRLAGGGMVAVPTDTATPTQSVSWGAPEIPTFTATPIPTQTSTPTSTPTPIVTPIRTPTPTPTPNPNVPPLKAQLGDEWVRPVDEMVMVYVPPPDAPFALGSGIMAPFEEYWIDQHPITNAQYQLCVDDGACSPSSFADDARFNGPDYPVVDISWFYAMDYIAWLNEAISDDVDWVYALPSEADWEYTAVGDSGSDYPWGDVFDGTLLNFCDTNCRSSHKNDDWDDGYPYTSPAGSYPDGVSWVGALDMAGNVWEWTDSWRNENERERVLRGGSWAANANYARAVSRFSGTPGSRDGNTGFRVVLMRRSPNLLPLEAQLGDEWLRLLDEMVMVYVPRPDTPFTLGSGVAAPSDEYWIDKHPVTNAQYQLCVNEGVCEPSRFVDDTRFNGVDYPVVGVSWFDAMDYVGWLNASLPDGTDWHYALPDEAMWEYAAGGEAGAMYPWGDEFDGTLLNFCDTNCTLSWKDDEWDDGYQYASPVGSYPDGASWVGALDLAGNVWEWTDSWGHENEIWRVVRGGSWDLNSNHARAATRDFISPDAHLSRNGFRVVLVRHAPSSS
jgi:formylglycine-generating enzyme required for sulfatase activity